MIPRESTWTLRKSKSDGLGSDPFSSLYHFIVANLQIKYYFCHRKQGEKIGCYRFIGTTVFGVQGGSDATLFFFMADWRQPYAPGPSVIFPDSGSSFSLISK